MTATCKRLSQQGRSDDIIVRLPLIEGFNTQEDIQRSTEKLRTMGAKSFDVFKYHTNINK